MAGAERSAVGLRRKWALEGLCDEVIRMQNGRGVFPFISIQINFVMSCRCHDVDVMSPTRHSLMALAQVLNSD